MSNDLELLIAEMNAKIAALSEKVAYLERLENAAVDGTGPYVLRTGDTMTGQLNIDPSAGITGGLLVLDSPGSDNSKYIFKFKSGIGDLVTLTEAGAWLSAANLSFSTDMGIASNSSGASLVFPAGGGGGTANIELNTRVASGTVKGVHGITAIGSGLLWSSDSIGGTAVSVIINGATDVIYILTGLFAVRDSAGNTATGMITGVAPGATFNLYDDGGTNTLQIIVNANGSVDVQRTAGSRTYKAALNLLWL